MSSQSTLAQTINTVLEDRRTLKMLSNKHQKTNYSCRLLDIVVSISMLILFFPFFIIASVLIKSVSKGPVIFKQIRIGQYGEPFTMLKFRSMHEDIDEAIHEQYVLDKMNRKEKMQKIKLI